MFEYYRTPGIFLKKIDKGEADQLFTIYTRDYGKLEVLAKGIKKMASKLRAQAEIFALSDIEFIQGKTYKTLTDSATQEQFRGVKTDLGKIGEAFRISELVDAAIRGPERDEKIWALLVETFSFLESAAVHNSGMARHYFFWNLFSRLGYRPELYHCCRCKKKLAPRYLRFSPGDGGIYCGECGHIEGTEAIDPETIKFIRMFCGQALTLKNVSRIKMTARQNNVLEMISARYLSTII